MDPDCPVAEALLVEGERIAAVGRYDELSPVLREGAAAVDLGGGCLLPGFNDAHIHVWKVGHFLTGLLDLRGVGSIVELQERLAVFAENYRGEWIVGRGFNELQLAERRLPVAADLDAVVPDRPVVLIRTCAHIAVTNRRAMQLAGIDRRSNPPPGGTIEKDERGRPTGVLAETALGLVMRHVPPPTAADYRRMIGAAGREMLSMGITSATDPAVLPDLLAVYREMAQAGVLPLRINALAIRLPDGGTEPLPLPEKYRDAHLRIDGIKFFSDGGLSGRTAALRRPYRGGGKGILRLEEDSFFELAAEAHRRGYRIGTHAIGDAAIEVVLRVYERLERELGQGKRHRIEHLGLPTEAHLVRIARRGIIAVPQAIFLRELGANFRAYLPGGYLRRCYPLRSVLDYGICLALSSDAPVVRNYHPLSGLQTAVLRRDERGVALAPEESISVEEGLKAYTVGGAMAGGDFSEKGTLSAGKLADLVVLDRDPLEAPVSQLEGIAVNATYLGGACRWRREEAE